MRLVRVLVAIATATIGTSALAIAAAPGKRPVTDCSAGMGMEIATTSTYRFALHVGMPEMMYTRAQVRKLHPKTGEVMLRGNMMMGMRMGGNTRHLEVHICLRDTEAVVTNADPQIMLKEDSTKGMSMNVPAAVMEGIGAGTADLHYGNNVPMPTGHRFTVTVTLKGPKAAFHVTSPKTTSMK
jgi:hypothetical protein